MTESRSVVASGWGGGKGLAAKQPSTHFGVIKMFYSLTVVVVI